MKSEKNGRNFENLFKKIKKDRYWQSNGIERKANEGAYKSNKTKTFRYGINIVIISKVKN